MPVVRKIDLFRLHRSEYAAHRAPRVVTVSKGQYLTATGRGTPGCDLFLSQVAALYAVAWTVKMAKKQVGKDFKLMPLEGLWWGDEPGRGDMTWKLLLRVPNFVRRRDLPGAVAALERRGRLGAAAGVRLEDLREGRCVQALHVGPYASEPETLERMARAASAHGLAFHGRHHEIYLSDPRRVAPERLRTILRQPVRAAR